MTRGSGGNSQRIIVLDIDGVLNSVRNLCHGIDPDNMAQLNDLIERTGAIVVVSSTWRSAGLPCMQDTLKANGLRGRVAGITPLLPRVRQGDHDVSPDRGEEIKAWLNVARPVPESIVILDDDGDMGELLPFLVRTNTQVGLTAADVERAVAILEAQP